MTKQDLDHKSIFYNYKDLVYNLALHYTQHTQDAEEVSQETFIKIFENIDTFRSEAALKTWIYRITINKSLDFLKSKKTNKNSMFLNNRLEPEQMTYDISTGNNYHPGVALEQQEAVSAIFDGINQLSEQHRTVITLLKVEQLSLAEVAIIMDLGHKAVESLFFRAKTKLLDILKNQ